VKTKFLTEKLKRLPQYFLEPAAAINSHRASQYGKEQHGEDTKIQYSRCGIDRL